MTTPARRRSNARPAVPAASPTACTPDPTPSGLAAIVWTDDDPEGWADCILDLARCPEIGRVLVGGRDPLAILDRVAARAPDAQAARKLEPSSTASLSLLLAQAAAVAPDDVLLMVAPYRLDPGLLRRGRTWLRSDRRFAAITGWEIADDPRALAAAPANASQSQLAAMSRRLGKRLGALRPVPIAAVHNGMALLGHSVIDVLQGLDRSLDKRPALSLMEFTVRCQRRGFMPVLDPLSVCRPLRASASVATANPARAELAERFKFMPQHFDAEAAGEHTPFGITRLLARRALAGLSLLVQHRPGYALSPLLLGLMHQAAGDPDGGEITLVTGGPLPFEEVGRIPVSPRITLARSFDALVRPVDLMFTGLRAAVPERIERLAKRLVLELQPNRPEDLSCIETRPGRAPDSFLVDDARTLRWLREASRDTPLDRAFNLAGGGAITQGPAVRHTPHLPFGPQEAGVQFALCIAPNYDGAAIDAARRALAATGRTLPLLVIDSLDGPERSSGLLGPLTAPVLILPRLSAGERAWCRAHAAVVFDHGAKASAGAADQPTDRFIDLCFDILSRQPRSP